MRGEGDGERGILLKLMLRMNVFVRSVEQCESRFLVDPVRDLNVDPIRFDS